MPEPEDKDKVIPVTEVRINEMINGAMKRFASTDLPKALEAVTTQMEGFQTVSTTLVEEIKALKDKEPVTPKVDDKGGDKGGDPEMNARMKQYEADNKKLLGLVDTLKTEGEAKEARAIVVDKESKVRQALGELNFVDGSAAEDAFHIVNRMVKRADDGDLTVGEDTEALPLADFVKTVLPKQRPYLLAADGVVGSGAGIGKPEAPNPKVSLEGIVPNADEAYLASVAKEIVKNL